MKNKSNKEKDIPGPQDGDTSLNKKKKKKKVSISPQGSPEEIAELNAFLQDIYKSLSPETAKQVSRNHDQEIDPMMIKSMLSEFLNCFALLGYDINGNRIIIKWTPDDQAEDSVIELIRCVFLNIAQNGYGNSNDGMMG